MSIESYIRRVCCGLVKDGYTLDQLMLKTGMTGRELKLAMAAPPGLNSLHFEYPDNIVQGLVDILVANPGITMRNAGKLLEQFFATTVTHADLKAFYFRAQVLSEAKLEDPSALFDNDDIELLKSMAEAHHDVLSMAEICAMWSECTGRVLDAATATKILRAEKPHEKE